MLLALRRTACSRVKIVTRMYFPFPYIFGLQGFQLICTQHQFIIAFYYFRVKYYPNIPEPFPEITITIHIRRKTLYYMYNIVFPCMMMSTLTVLVFCLPPDSGKCFNGFSKDAEQRKACLWTDFQNFFFTWKPLPKTSTT